MKTVREGVCLVDINDLLFKPIKHVELDKVVYEEGELAILRREEDVKYIMSLDYILDYDKYCSLSNEGINTEISKLEQDATYYWDRVLNTPQNERYKLWRDKEFSEGYNITNYKLESLRCYNLTREDYDDKIASYELLLKGKTKTIKMGE